MHIMSQNFSTSLLRERIHQEEIVKTSNRIKLLQDQKPEYLKAFFEDAKETEFSMSEDEVKARIDYEMSKLNTGLWAMIEKDRKKKAFAANRNKKKGIGRYD